MDILQTDSGMQFTPKYFQEGRYVHGAQLTLASPEHQERNGQVEVIYGKHCKL